MLIARGETVVSAFTDLCNAIVKEGKVPDDWKRSTIVTLYKGKGDCSLCSLGRLTTY